MVHNLILIKILSLFGVKLQNQRRPVTSLVWLDLASPHVLYWKKILFWRVQQGESTFEHTIHTHGAELQFKVQLHCHKMSQLWHYLLKVGHLTLWVPSILPGNEFGGIERLSVFICPLTFRSLCAVEGQSLSLSLSFALSSTAAFYLGRPSEQSFVHLQII